MNSTGCWRFWAITSAPVRPRLGGGTEAITGVSNDATLNAPAIRQRRGNSQRLRIRKRAFGPSYSRR